jgi:hypothetical protein
VPENSATYDGVHGRGLNVDHFGLNKFGSRDDNYRRIQSKIVEMMNAPSLVGSYVYKDMEEIKLLQNLGSNHDYEEYKDFNRDRVEGTCEWFFNDDRFCNWRESSNSGLLWVSAGPGCGKSVLSRALVDEQRLIAGSKTTYVCHFFFQRGR